MSASSSMDLMDFPQRMSTHIPPPAKSSLDFQLQPTTNPNFACSPIPTHWRCGKTLPTPFQVWELRVKCEVECMSILRRACARALSLPLWG